MNDLKGNQQDEFQFKPLTKGLGFHPKKETNPVGSTLSTPTVSKAAAQTTQTTSAPAARSLRLDTPLPRPETKRTPPPSTSSQTVENILHLQARSRCAP